MNQKPDEVRQATGNGSGDSRRVVSGTGSSQRERPDVSLSQMPSGAMNEGEAGPQRSSAGEMPSGDMNASMPRPGARAGRGERMTGPMRGRPGPGEMPGGAMAQQGTSGEMPVGAMGRPGFGSSTGEPGEMPAGPTEKGIPGGGTEETGGIGQGLTLSGTWKMSFTIDGRV
jgi:hypothetical protein